MTSGKITVKTCRPKSASDFELALLKGRVVLRSLDARGEPRDEGALWFFPSDARRVARAILRLFEEY